MWYIKKFCLGKLTIAGKAKYVFAEQTMEGNKYV